MYKNGLVIPLFISNSKTEICWWLSLSLTLAHWICTSSLQLHVWSECFTLKLPCECPVLPCLVRQGLGMSIQRLWSPGTGNTQYLKFRLDLTNRFYKSYVWTGCPRYGEVGVMLWHCSHDDEIANGSCAHYLYFTHNHISFSIQESRLQMRIWK